MWKNFKDNYIKKLDLQMFHRIAEGRRREVPLRLFRILDKRFYKKYVARSTIVELYEFDGEEYFTERDHRDLCGRRCFGTEPIVEVKSLVSAERWLVYGLHYTGQ